MAFESIYSGLSPRERRAAPIFINTSNSDNISVPKQIPLHPIRFKSRAGAFHPKKCSGDSDNKENFPISRSPAKMRTWSFSSTCFSQRSESSSNTSSSSPSMSQLNPKLNLLPTKSSLPLFSPCFLLPSTVSLAGQSQHQPTIICNNRICGHGMDDYSDKFNQCAVKGNMENIEPYPETIQDLGSLAEPSSQEDILTNNFPREKGSQEREHVMIADMDRLATIPKDHQTEGHRFFISDLLPETIQHHLELPSHKKQDVTAVQDRPAGLQNNKVGTGGCKRSLFRGALSLLQSPAGSESSPPGSSSSEHINFSITVIKRVNRPDMVAQQSLSKRGKCSQMEERTSSMEEGGVRHETATTSSGNPKIHCCNSEKKLRVIMACQLKEEMENILPDGTR